MIPIKLSVIMWIFTALSGISTVLSYAVPRFRKNYLIPKMVCSFMFLMTGIFAAYAYSAEKAMLDTDHTPMIYSILIVIALFFGLVGDFFVEWREGKHFLIAALLFGIGHLTYFYTFAFLVSPPLLGYRKQILLGFAALCVVSVIHVIINKIKFVGKNKLVCIYSLCLMISFISAVSRGFVCVSGGNTAFGAMLIAAGFLFLASDGALAAMLFGSPLTKRTDAIVLFTYFPAQTLFALSIYFQ